MNKSELKRQGAKRREFILQLRVELGYSRRAVARMLELSLTRVDALERHALKDLGYTCLPEEAIMDLRSKFKGKDDHE